MKKDISRRRLLRASAATAAGMGAIGTVSGAEGDDSLDTDEFQPVPVREFDDADFETVDDVPDTADGIRTASQMFMHGEDGGSLSEFGFERPGGCSANFIWRAVDADQAELPDAVDVDLPEQAEGKPGDGDLFIGAAGHCFLPGSPAVTEGGGRNHEDEEVVDVSDLRVTVCADCRFGGATTVFGLNGWGTEAGTDEVYNEIELGEVVYARWGVPDEDSDIGHDFGIVRIPEEKRHLVDPSMPQWGGPDGVSPGPIPENDPIHQYGAGVGNGEVFATKASSGVSFGGSENAWFAGIRASPGDSGSPIIGSNPTDAPETGGPAAGVVTHLSGNGTAGTTIQRCKEMAKEDIGLEIEVVQPGDLE